MIDQLHPETVVRLLIADSERITINTNKDLIFSRIILHEFKFPVTHETFKQEYVAAINLLKKLVKDNQGRLEDIKVLRSPPLSDFGKVTLVVLLSAHKEITMPLETIGKEVEKQMEDLAQAGHMFHEGA